MLERRRDDGDEIGFAQPALGGCGAQVAAGALVQHRGVGGAQGQFAAGQADAQDVEQNAGLFLGRETGIEQPRKTEGLGFGCRQFCAQFIGLIALEAVDVFMGAPGAVDQPDAVADQPDAHAKLREDHAGLNACQIFRGLFGVGEHAAVIDAHLAELAGQGARAFQRREVRALDKSETGLVALDREEKQATVIVDRAAGHEDMVVAQIGNPGQRTVDFVAAVDAPGGLTGSARSRNRT